MIIGNKENLESISFKYIDKKIKNIIELSNKIDFKVLEDNTYNINGKNLLYNITSYKTSNDIAEKYAERHKKYIDIQLLLYGEERFGYSDISSIKKVFKEYDEEQDIELYQHIENEEFFLLRQNMFAVFFPEDIHRPGLSYGSPRNVRKVIFKLAI
jgi:YhcH/YjgK/YiaL family protein